ncbi:MAG TPA: hypothetical protein VFE47_18895, partial [Tepidisphaeraceae bacterium]|nr:hypothetical protein [Tepidisphaeraceae bacterium]
MAIRRNLASETAPQNPVKSDVAAKMILEGKAPANLRVAGTLSFAGNKTLRQLPDGLTVGSLNLSGCTGLRQLPPGLRVRHLDLSGAWNPSHLLAGLKCYDLNLKDTAIASLPAGMNVEYRMNLEGCTGLRELPEGLKIGSLIVRGCLSLELLPEGIDVYFLDISACTAISRWPARGSIAVGRLTARGCAQLRSLPPWMTRVSQLDLRDCTNLRELPEGLVVTSWVDIAGTRIRSLPASLKGVQLRWRGITVDERIAFRPELITVEEILGETNAERRRVLLERMGYDIFLEHAKAQTLDQDTDAGGPRRLVKVAMANDEDLVCVTVLCPSTARQYVIRVPPT